jgi:hypothetical protein
VGKKRGKKSLVMEGLEKETLVIFYFFFQSKPDTLQNAALYSHPDG